MGALGTPPRWDENMNYTPGTAAGSPADTAVVRDILEQYEAAKRRKYGASRVSPVANEGGGSLLLTIEFLPVWAILIGAGLTVAFMTWLGWGV